MFRATDIDVKEKTALRLSVRVFPAVIGILSAVSLGTALYLTLQFQAVVPPSAPVVSGSTHHAVWEAGTAADLTFNGAAIQVTNGRSELKRRSDWWNVSYVARLPLSITTGATPLTAGKTVSLTTSTNPYVPLGLMQADRDDLRIVYWNGTTNQEIARDYISIAEVRFKIQADIPAQTTTTSSYYMYFGNPDATAPVVNLNDVYAFGEDFTSDVFGRATPWKFYCGADQPFTVASNVLRKTSSHTNDCFAYNPAVPLDSTKNWYVESSVTITSGTQPVNASLHLHDQADLLPPDGSPNDQGYWLGLSDQATDKLYIRSHDGSFTPSVDATVNLGTAYRLTWRYGYLAASQHSHKAWVNRVSITDPPAFDAEDAISNFSSGTAYAGVHSYQTGATSSDVTWDTFRVWEDTGVTAVGGPVLQGQYLDTYPSVELASGKGMRYGTLTGFSALASNLSNVAFQLSGDDGATWYYHTGGGWATSNGTWAQSSSAALIAALLPSSPFPVQNGTFRWRALLASPDNGRTFTWLDQVAVRFTTDTTDLDGDGYTNAAAGGADCEDSQRSVYLEGTPGCTEFDSATMLSIAGPIADHAWVQDDSGLYHLYFQEETEPWDIMHYTSADLQSITLVGTALSGTPGAWDFDGAWAPHVIRKDGTYYMFYAGVTGPGGNPTAYQRIGVATSTDLTTWTKVPVNNCGGTTGDGCVYECQAAWTAWSRGGGYDRQCRDPMVIFDPAAGVWKLFATARALSDSNQVVTVATSPDLTTWTSQGYIEASHGARAENPFVTEYNGVYSLLFTNYDSGYIKYAQSATLGSDSSGSTNWVFQSSINETGKNAPEVSVINNDTWILSESNYAQNPLSADLILKRLVWQPDDSFALANLTKLACRVGSDTIHPEAAEVCSDGIDNNCSGTADEAALCAACVDVDGDGYGATATAQCTYPQGDCDDSRSNDHPTAIEVCDQRDNDCDGSTDEGDVCTLPVTVCTPSWSCGAWSTCVDRQQTRTCTDDNACGTDTDKPATTQVCEPTPTPVAACAEDWRCTEWSTCADGQRSRTCRDQNACGSVAGKPVEQEACRVGDTETGGGDQRPAERLIGAVPNRGQVPQVRLFTADGKRSGQFVAYARQFGRSGANLAVGDVTGDGKAEIVTGTLEGTQPLMRVFNQRGKVLHQFSVFGTRARTGVTVATGDLDGDGIHEILTTPGAQAAAQVQLYDFDPSRPWFSKRATLTAHKSHTQGLSLAAGDVDGDGLDELIVARLGRTQPRVYLYDYRPTTRRFVLKRSFTAFSKTQTNGVIVAAGDVNGDGLDDIIASAGPGGRPEVRVFDARGALQGKFLAAGASFTGGAYPTALDVDGDGKDEILTSSNRSGAPNIFIFQRTPANQYRRLRSIAAYPPAYVTGLRINASP